MNHHQKLIALLDNSVVFSSLFSFSQLKKVISHTKKGQTKL
jgi:hypothetical protein